MKKRICALLAAVFLLALCTPVAGAQEQRVFDQAKLMTKEDVGGLEREIEAMRRKTQMDFLVVTIDNTQGKSAMTYADDFYDQGGYGTGEEKSGALFLLDMQNREIYISTSGKMIDYLTDKRIESVLDNAAPYMASGDYARAVHAFLTSTEDYIDRGIPVGQYRRHTVAGKLTVGEIALFFLIAVGAGACVCAAMLYRYRGKQSGSSYPYTEKGRLELERQEDVFVNETLTSRRIPRATSSGSGSGRSSTHTSGGGRTHGGGGRKF